MHWSHEFDEVMDKLGWPDLGDWKVWRWWFARSLSILEQHGWFELLWGELGGLTTGELAPERETIFALRWLVEDFCSEVDGYGEYDPYWHDWFDALEIPRWGQIPAALKHQVWPEVESQARYEVGVPDDPAEYDDEIIRQTVEDELDSSLTTQSMLLVIAEKRRSSVRILMEAWGGHDRLYQSLFAALHSTSGVIESDDDGLYADEQSDEDEEGAGHIEAFETLLDRWRGITVNELAKESLELPDSLAELGERLTGHGWVYEDCPIRVSGSPEFLAIGSID